MNPVKNNARASRPKGLGRAVSNGMKGRILIEGNNRLLKHRRRLGTLARRTLLFLKKDASLDIFLVGNNLMKKNVLAFRAILGFPRPDVPRPYLGEIYLNPDYIHAHGESLEYMALHGILHLLGYDHVKTHDRIRMERKEQFLLKKLGK